MHAILTDQQEAVIAQFDGPGEIHPAGVLMHLEGTTVCLLYTSDAADE